jgi:hypothetical protein
MPAVLVLSLSDSNHLTYATTAPRSISKDRGTGQLGLVSGETRAGILTRDSQKWCARFGSDLGQLRKKLRGLGAEVFDSFPPYRSWLRHRFGIENDQA